MPEAGDVDPEFDDLGEGHRPRPTSEPESDDIDIAGMREDWLRWLPNVPLPPEWREDAPKDAAPAKPEPGSETSEPASEKSEVGSETSEPASEGDDEWPEPRRHQDRVQRGRHHDAPHSFRSRPPIDRQPPHGYAVGVGYLVLTLRELNCISQRVLARRAGTSQSAITRVETGAHTPSMSTVIRLAHAGGYRLVLGLASPDIAEVEPDALAIDDLALVGLLVPDPMDGLPNFRVIREPPPWAGRED
jgi:transcriptional regulator with XRE-family HTH domain